MNDANSPLPVLDSTRLLARAALRIASIHSGNEPRRASTISIVRTSELRAQQRLFGLDARDERRDEQRRE